MFGFYDRRCVCCVDILVGRIKMEIRCKQDTAEITWLNAQFSQGENKIPMSLTFSSFSSYFSLFSYFLIFSSFVFPSLSVSFFCLFHFPYSRCSLFLL